MIQRFTAFRHNISARGTHSEYQRNPDDQPQFEGVIWTDGTCTLRWMTASKSTSMFASFAEMLTIHGHPEYGTELVFEDSDPPEAWFDALRRYGRALEADSGGLLVFREITGKLGVTAMYVEMADNTGVDRVLYKGRN